MLSIDVMRYGYSIEFSCFTYLGTQNIDKRQGLEGGENRICIVKTSCLFGLTPHFTLLNLHTVIAPVMLPSLQKWFSKYQVPDIVLINHTTNSQRLEVGHTLTPGYDDPATALPLLTIFKLEPNRIFIVWRLQLKSPVLHLGQRDHVIIECCVQ